MSNGEIPVQYGTVPVLEKRNGRLSDLSPYQVAQQLYT